MPNVDIIPCLLRAKVPGINQETACGLIKEWLWWNFFSGSPTRTSGGSPARAELATCPNGCNTHHGLDRDLPSPNTGHGHQKQRFFPTTNLEGLSPKAARGPRETCKVGMRLNDERGEKLKRGGSKAAVEQKSNFAKHGK